MKILLGKLKTIGPWIAAAGIFAYLFHLYPPAKVWKSLTYVNLVPFSLFCIAYFFFIYLIDAAVTKYVIGRFTHKVKFRDVALARGVTYLLMVISYPASQAGYAYFFKRKHKIPIFEILGVFFFIMIIDLTWVITLALIGSFFQDYTIGNLDLSRIARIAAFLTYLFLFIWLAFWRKWPDKKFWKTIMPNWLYRQRRRRAFDIFNSAKLTDYIRIALMRIPILLTIVASTYVVVKTFNCHVPFTVILGNVPLVLLIGTLPITPGGLGTTNAVLVELLKNDITGPVLQNGLVTPAELLFSVSLLWMFGNYLLKILTGTILMAFVPKKLFQPTPHEPEEKVEKEASHLQIP
jgi:uncharacterized membrane protein YbhN (UPF0104 family)